MDEIMMVYLFIEKIGKIKKMEANKNGKKQE